MKKHLSYIILFLFVFGTLQANAAGVRFMQKPFNKVFKKAQKKGKPIFVDVYADWCGPCKMMDKEVFSRDDVSEFLNENFICLKMDVDKDYYIYEKFEYDITKLPTILFLDSEGKLIKKYVGSTSGTSLLSMARSALDA